MVGTGAAGCPPDPAGSGVLAGVAVRLYGGGTTVGATREPPVGVGAAGGVGGAAGLAGGAIGAAVGVRAATAVGVGSIFHTTGVGVPWASSVIGAAFGPHAQVIATSITTGSQRTPISESILMNRLTNAHRFSTSPGLG